MYLTMMADAGCDLPASVFARYDADILPLELVPKKQIAPSCFDSRDPQETLSFYEENHASWKLMGADKSDFIERLNERWLYHSDGLLAITPARRYSNTYEKLREACFEVEPELNQLRELANLKGLFRIRLFDSGQLYAGYGLAMHQALSLSRDQRLPIDKLHRPLNEFCRKVVLMYCTPESRRLREAKDGRFEKAGWLKHPFGSKSACIYRLIDGHHKEVERVRPEQAVNRTLERMLGTLQEHTLAHRFVNVCYAGPLDVLRGDEVFQEIHKAVRSQDGVLWLSPMSMSSMVELGKGALSVAFVG